MNDLITTFKALSDKTRLRIIKLLEEGELCVCDLVAALDMVQPKVSFHLRTLKQANLLKDRKVGKWMRYRLDDVDMFRRFLILAVNEKISDTVLEDDKKRLTDFMKRKAEGILGEESFCKKSCVKQ